MIRAGGQRRWRAAIPVVAAVAAVGLTATPAAAEGAVIGAGAPHTVPNSYLVELRTGTQAVPSLAATLAGRYGATVTHTYRHAVRGFAVASSEAVARRLAADPAVLRVQQDVAVSLSATQSGPPSWGLERLDQRVRPPLNGYTYPNAGAGVRAYVIDTGIRLTHQDFGGRAVFGVNALGDGNNTDCNGHGTHVAGTVGGAAFGVAKAVSLVAVKVLNCGGGSTAAVVMQGVDWVTGNHVAGPAVANMSLGFPANTVNVPMMETAVRNSIADGIVYTVASGNDNANACGVSPARVPEAITVNATDAADNRAPFSNVGACTDIFAPGVDIGSAGHTSDTAAAVMSGTSMAAPHVAGAAALVLAANPALNPQQVAATLYANATLNLVGNAGGSPNRLLFVAHPAPPSPPPGPDHLIRGQFLYADQYLQSANGHCKLYLQNDGNMSVLRDNAPIWSTGTSGHPGSYATLQWDGNFVLYPPSGPALKATATYGTAATALYVQDDCNVVLYGDSFQVYWFRSLPLYG